MKIDWNRKYNTIAVYVLLVVAISILFVVAVFKFAGLLTVLGMTLEILMPVILGLGFAYVLNPLMKFFDREVFRRIFRKKPRPKLTRALSVTATVLAALAILAALIMIIVPEIAKSVMRIFNNVDVYMRNAQEWTEGFVANNPDMEKYLAMVFTKAEEFISDLANVVTKNMNQILSTLSSGVAAVLSVFTNFIMGFIISVYLLLSKEMFKAQTKKVLFAFLPVRICRRILRDYHRADTIFAGYIGGQLLDATIVGILCFIGMSILGLPYAVLISVLVAVTNLIPYLGPFIGAIPSALLILVDGDPLQSVWFLLFILILQQVDGNIINPRIQGGSTGLPAFWVIVALMVGGGLFGAMGMLLAVPVFAVIYMLMRGFIEDRLQRRRLPSATNSYKGNVEHIGEKPPPPEMPEL